MAQQKKSTKKTRSKKSDQPSPKIAWLFIALILSLIAVFVITSTSNKTKKENKNTTEYSNDSEKKITVKKEKIDKEKQDVFSAILSAAEKLNIPDNYFRPITRDEDIYLKLPVNKLDLDLNYVNMIIKGHVELAGGLIKTTRENSNSTSQTMTIIDEAKNQKYTVKLYYDTKREYEKHKPKLSIIIDDFGQFKGELLEEFCELPKEVTFAIIPGLPHAQTVMYKAKETNHESIIHAPMEPLNYPKNNPGENAIFVNMSEKEITKQIQKYIKELPLTQGINNHMGSLATSDKDVMKAVLDVVKENDLYFIDSRTSSSSVAYEVAQKLLIPSEKRDIFLDVPDSSMKTTRTHLNKLKKFKTKNSNVVVISHCANRKKLNQLKEFIREAKFLGFELVPASQLFENNLPEIM